MLSKKTLIHIGSIITSLILLTATAYAISAVVSGGNRITNDGTAVKITANNTCQTVKNNGTLGDIFVPTNTLNEWNIFTSNKPAYVELGLCCTPDSPQTRTLLCSSEQIGSIIQTRTSTCPDGAVAPTYNSWATTSNTCVKPVPVCTGGFTTAIGCSCAGGCPSSYCLKVNPITGGCSCPSGCKTNYVSYGCTSGDCSCGINSNWNKVDIYETAYSCTSQ